MRVTYLVLIAILLSSITTANARPYSDRVGVCSTFKGDTKLSSDVCLISYWTAVGGRERTLKTATKTYVASENDVKDDVILTLNGIKAESYYRHAAFLNVLSEDDDASGWNAVTAAYEEGELFYCYKSKGVDICYN